MKHSQVQIRAESKWIPFLNMFLWRFFLTNFLLFFTSRHTLPIIHDIKFCKISTNFPLMHSGNDYMHDKVRPSCVISICPITNIALACFLFDISLWSLYFERIVEFLVLLFCWTRNRFGAFLRAIITETIFLTKVWCIFKYSMKITFSPHFPLLYKSTSWFGILVGNLKDLWNPYVALVLEWSKQFSTKREIVGRDRSYWIVPKFHLIWSG